MLLNQIDVSGGLQLVKQQEAERHLKNVIKKGFESNQLSEAKANYKSVVKKAADIIKTARNGHYRSKLANATNSKDAFSIINKLLNKDVGTSKLPDSNNDTKVADNLGIFFRTKLIKSIMELKMKLTVNLIIIPIFLIYVHQT